MYSYNWKPPIVIMSLKTMKSSMIYFLTSFHQKETPDKSSYLHPIWCFIVCPMIAYILYHSLNMQDIKVVWYMDIGMIQYRIIKFWKFCFYYSFLCIYENYQSQVLKNIYFTVLYSKSNLHCTYTNLSISTIFIYFLVQSALYIYQFINIYNFHLLFSPICIVYIFQFINIYNFHLRFSPICIVYTVQIYLS
jgi:hypothetical protein